MSYEMLNGFGGGITNGDLKDTLWHSQTVQFQQHVVRRFVNVKVCMTS